jgi:competence protein ComFC
MTEFTYLKILSKRTFSFADFFIKGLGHLIWPPVCLNCLKHLAESKDSLCPDCWNMLLASTNPDYCPHCGQSVSRYAVLPDGCSHCFGQQVHFDGIARAGIYSDVLRKMILGFKKDRTELAPVLTLLADSVLQGSFFAQDIQLFVPVPLHWTRRILRGYNQSYLFAKELSYGRIKVSTDLVRIRRTAMQTSLSLAKRAANVADAFAVRRDHEFSGKTICLVDDVKTTGATLNECAKVLKENGASKVYALVLAVAGRQSPDS